MSEVDRWSLPAPTLATLARLATLGVLGFGDFFFVHGHPRSTLEVTIAGMLLIFVALSTAWRRAVRASNRTYPRPRPLLTAIGMTSLRTDAANA